MAETYTARAKCLSCNKWRDVSWIANTYAEANHYFGNVIALEPCIDCEKKTIDANQLGVTVTESTHVNQFHKINRKIATKLSDDSRKGYHYQENPKSSWQTVLDDMDACPTRKLDDPMSQVTERIQSQIWDKLLQSIVR